MKATSPTRKPALGRTATQITEEQRKLLLWTASLGAVTAPALALRLDASIASARARLAAVQRRGLLESVKPLADQPALFTITRAGLRAVETRGIDLCKVSASTARHLALCALVAASLERCYPDHTVIGERELRREERELGDLLASVRLGGNAGIHRPDLVMKPPAGFDERLRVAVEVELTIKAPGRLEAICRGWARCRTIDGVLYVAPPDVERALARAVKATRAGERVAVVLLSALPGCDVS